jgi:hypothetical protein
VRFNSRYTHACNSLTHCIAPRCKRYFGAPLLAAAVWAVRTDGAHTPAVDSTSEWRLSFCGVAAAVRFCCSLRRLPPIAYSATAPRSRVGGVRVLVGGPGHPLLRRPRHGHALGRAVPVPAHLQGTLCPTIILWCAVYVPAHLHGTRFLVDFSCLLPLISRFHRLPSQTPNILSTPTLLSHPQVVLAAEECNTLAFHTHGPHAFLCPEKVRLHSAMRVVPFCRTRILTSPHRPIATHQNKNKTKKTTQRMIPPSVQGGAATFGGHWIADERIDVLTAVTFAGLLLKVFLPSFLWGAGTAIGEIPPYAVSRAARL